MGAAISPTSAYNAGQFDISLLVWKVRRHLSLSHACSAVPAGPVLLFNGNSSMAPSLSLHGAQATDSGTRRTSLHSRPCFSLLAPFGFSSARLFTYIQRISFLLLGFINFKLT